MAVDSGNDSKQDRAGMAPASQNGSCQAKEGATGSSKESKRGLLEESIVQME